MRGLTLLLAATLTASYSYAATAAMVADRTTTVARVEVEAPVPADMPVWNGGVLEAVTVEAPAPTVVIPLPHSGLHSGRGTVRKVGIRPLPPPRLT